MFLQQDLFPPPSSWHPPRVSELVSFRDARRVAFDVETHDPNLTKLGMGSLRDGEIVGFSYAIDQGPRFYVPLRHRGGDNVEDPWRAIGWLREEAAAFEGELVGAHLQYDLCFSLSSGVEFRNVHRFRDIQVGEALIDELADRYDLDSLCAKYQFEPKDTDMLEHAARVLCKAKTNTDIKKAISQLPARYVGAYGEADADRPLLILREQEKEFERQGLADAWELESRVLPALLMMRRRGLLVDWDHLERLDKFARARCQMACDHVNTLHTSPPLRVQDLNRPDVLHRVLEAGGIHNPYRTARGKPSVTKEFLEAAPGEMGKAIREAKKWEKVRSTYIAGVRQHAINGRIHCTYNQTRGVGDDDSGDVEGAATFRLSCKDPNLQAQPGRDPEIGPLWRKTYIPDEGKEWTSNDYSQQEPRFTTHFAAMMDLPRAREAAQRYCDDPNTDNHQMMADLTGGRVKRKEAKEIFLGICYGQGGAKTADKIGLPTSRACRPPREWRKPFGTVYYEDEHPDTFLEAQMAGGYSWTSAGKEARVIIETLEREVPYVGALAKEVKKKAEKSGVIRTFFGHLAHFPRDSHLRDELLRKALNRLIQVSSAGQTKKALVDLHEAGEYIQLQVHDEIGGSVDDEAHAQRWGNTMRSGAQLMVPNKVDVETGPSWGESMSEGAESLAKMMKMMEEMGI